MQWNGHSLKASTYINYLSAAICDSDCGLFVDDVCIWLGSPNEQVVISRLNAELERIYSWACLNKVVFDFKKFHLLDMGGRLQSESKVSVRYGNGAPEWTDSAKYLGVLLDNNLDFLPMIEERCDKFNKSTWRVFNHSNLVTGASPRTLEIIFSSWLFPLVEYGSAIWIFRIKEHFHYSYPILSCYKDVFTRLEVLYNRIAKAILGVDKSASNIATLVRLGWMPLDYRLAFRACIWYMKIRLGLAGLALRNQYIRLSHISNDESWANSGFYRPAHDFIKRLDPSLLGLTNIDDFSVALRDLIFDELTQRWGNCSHARICHVIHPRWEVLRWSRMIFSRQTCSSYHQIAVGRGKFGDRYKYSKNKRSCNPNCKLGCSVISSVHHFFFDCPYCINDILDLQSICSSKRISYDLKKFFTQPCLQPRVELFLKKVIDF